MILEGEEDFGATLGVNNTTIEVSKCSDAAS